MRGHIGLIKKQFIDNKFTLSSSPLIEPCRIWDNFNRRYGFSLTRRKDVMTGHTVSHAKSTKKKLLKREQRVLERLKAAQQAQARALERYHRAEERLQKRMARVQHVEGDLVL